MKRLVGVRPMGRILDVPRVPVEHTPRVLERSLDILGLTLGHQLVPITNKVRVREDREGEGQLSPIK